MTKPRKKKIRIVAPKKGAAADRPNSSSHYEELLNCIYDALLISDADASVIEVNQRAMESFLFSQEEFMGMPMLDLLPDADIEFLQTLKRMPAAKYALIETRCCRKDGSFFPSEIAVKSMGGRGNNLAFFVRNITKRKEAESQLKLVVNAVRNSLTAIVITDEEGFVRFANPAADHIFGNEFGGRNSKGKENIARYFIENNKFENALSDLLEAESWRGELRIRRNDGTNLDAEVAAVPNEQDGKLNGFVFSILDITNEKAAERERQINARNATTIAALGAACHHLAQPATVLCVNAEMISSSICEHDDPEILDLISQNSKAAGDLQEKLRDLNDITLYRTEKYLDREEYNISNTIIRLDG